MESSKEELHQEHWERVLEAQENMVVLEPEQILFQVSRN
jgi:hypothetical protein